MEVGGTRDRRWPHKPENRIKQRKRRKERTCRDGATRKRQG